DAGPRHGRRVLALVPIQAPRVFSCRSALYAVCLAHKAQRTGDTPRSQASWLAQSAFGCADVAGWGGAVLARYQGFASAGIRSQCRSQALKRTERRGGILAPT